jgi:hypothetical protein
MPEILRAVDVNVHGSAKCGFAERTTADCRSKLHGKKCVIKVYIPT